MQQHILEAMRIRLKHVVGFQALTIDLKSGEVTELKGENGSGKTTVLKLCRDMASGKAFKVPSHIVSDFETAAEVELSVADGLTILREIKSGATDATTTVLDQYHRAVTKSPMDFIRQTLGDGRNLNPVELANMEKVSRTKAIIAALDIDPARAKAALGELTEEPWDIREKEEVFTVLKQAEKAYEQKQTAANALADDAEHMAESNLRGVPDDWKEAKGQIAAPVEPKLLGDVYDKLSKAKAENQQRKNLSAQLAVKEDDLRRQREEVSKEELRASSANEAMLEPLEDTSEIEQKIQTLTAELDAMKQRNSERSLKIKEADQIGRNLELRRSMLVDEEVRLAALQAQRDALGAEVDVTALQAEIDAHSDKTEIWKEAVKVHGDRSVRYAAFERYQEEAEAKRAAAGEVTRTLKAIRNLPLQLLEGVSLPIPGMEIIGDTVYLPQTDDRDGSTTLREFDAFGDGDKIRYAAMIIMLLAPFNGIFIDGAEALSLKNRLLLYRTIAEMGFIGLVTVADDSPFSINTYDYEQLTQ